MISAADQLAQLVRERPTLVIPFPAERARKGVVEMLSLLLHSLRNEYGIFSGSHCEHCCTFGPGLDGTFQHAPDCLIGQALAVIAEDGR